MKKIKLTSVILTLLGVLLAVGVITFFSACPVGEKAMICHYAQQAVLGIGIVEALLGLVHLLVNQAQIRVGLDVGILLDGILAVLVPGTLIRLCKMESMRCQAIMKPAVWIVGGLLVLTAAADILLNLRQSGKKEKEHVEDSV
ncbi:MAG: DUF4418 family protein [Lachnospiraceae bacterium]|nr:DUF4418 family protein [Lachnospiraceae bacterium]